MIVISVPSLCDVASVWHPVERGIEARPPFPSEIWEGLAAGSARSSRSWS
jgi:hypothetical protein